MKTLSCSKRSKCSSNGRGLITVSTVVFVSVFMLMLFLSFLFVGRYVRNYYYTESTTLKSIIFIHDAIVNSCCYGCSGSSVAVFVPSGSYMYFQENYLNITGINVKAFNREYLETILKSRMRCNFIDIEVRTGKDTLLLKYYVLTTSERKQVTFTRFTIPPGSHVVFIYCRAFHKIEITFVSSG